MTEKPKRASRTTAEQYSLYLNLLEQNKFFREGKLTPLGSPKAHEKLWEELAIHMNACGNGPIKTVTAWQKSMAEWKSKVLKKAREGKDLKLLEQSLIQAFGNVLVSGIETTEIGLNNEIAQAEEGETQTVEVVCEEVLEVIVEDPTIKENIKSMPKFVANKLKGKRTSTRPTQKSALLTAYIESQNNQIAGLSAIAKSLDGVAAAINRVADVMKKN